MKKYQLKEERAEIDKFALTKEKEDARDKAADELLQQPQLQNVMLISSVYEVPVWQKHKEHGFWERFPLKKPEDKHYRLYLHCWSEVLQDVVQVAVVELNAKTFKRMTR